MFVFEMREIGDAMAATLRDQPNTSRLVSKKERFFKNWQRNAGIIDNREAAVPGTSLTSVWNRDIVAAKLILYYCINL